MQLTFGNRLAMASRLPANEPKFLMGKRRPAFQKRAVLRRQSFFPAHSIGFYRIAGLLGLPKEALIKASIPNFNFYWLGEWPPQ